MGRVVNGDLIINIADNVDLGVPLSTVLIMQASDFDAENIDYDQSVYDLVMMSYSVKSIIPKLAMYLIEKMYSYAYGTVVITTVKTLASTVPGGVHPKSVQKVLNLLSHRGYITKVDGLGAYANGEYMFIVNKDLPELDVASASEPTVAAVCVPILEELVGGSTNVLTPLSDVLAAHIDDLLKCHTTVYKLETGVLDPDYVGIIKMDLLKKIQNIAKQLHEYVTIV